MNKETEKVMEDLEEFQIFHNRLRILFNIDRDDMIKAGALSDDDARGWQNFRDNPWRWFIYATNAEAEAVMEIIKKREKRT